MNVNDIKVSPYFSNSKNAKIECDSNRATRKEDTVMLPNKVRMNQSKTKLVELDPTENASKKLKSESLLLGLDPVKSEPIQPENWETVLENIRTMRLNRDAPVDYLGAELCANKDCPPKVRRFQVLVSLMLSSQTKDQLTFAAMEKLKQHGLTCRNIINTNETDIAQLIYPVGFWKKKASYIKRTAEILAEQYNEDIPKTVKELCLLPGVGEKVAVITINIAWEKTIGIGVDTHVHRIANRLGWTLKATKTPEKTREALEDWLPRSLWGEVNVLFVGFGQQQCTPVKPKCDTCLNQHLCPVGKTQLLKKKC